MFKRLFAIGVLAIYAALFSGFSDEAKGGVRLDSGSLDTLKTSMQAALKELAPEERIRFRNAFVAIERSKSRAFIDAILEFENKISYEITREDERRLSKALSALVKEKQGEFVRFLDGKTAQEIIEYADQIDAVEPKPDISQITTKILSDLKIAPNEITKEKGVIEEMHTLLMHPKGKIISAIPIVALDRARNSYNITIRPYNSAAPNDEQGFSARGYPNALSLKSWDNPILSRNSNANDQTRGSTALALIFDPEWDREEWATKALGAKTAITGPATGKLKDGELNTDKYWIYDPADGNVKLMQRENSNSN
ncbi:MAG: hypothetical protein LBE89_02795 [Helicobacteraceae bacterium]|jgi:hypothetical protein|nr:hypothetical protein [Helicobacteraceae bacterium]